MSNESVTIRFAQDDLTQIDKKIKEGKFTSRSDFVRYAVRHSIFEMDRLERNLDILGDMATEKGITRADVRRSVRKVRKRVYKEEFGND